MAVMVAGSRDGAGGGRGWIRWSWWWWWLEVVVVLVAVVVVMVFVVVVAFQDLSRWCGTHLPNARHAVSPPSPQPIHALGAV